MTNKFVARGGAYADIHAECKQNHKTSSHFGERVFEFGKRHGVWALGNKWFRKDHAAALIAGLIRPTSGSISLDNQRLGKNMDFPPSMGLLIENPAFLPSLTGLENLKLLAEINARIKPRTIAQTLSSVGLDPRDPRKVKKYSLGMKQRLGLAAAFMESPDLILLDEPTNALDVDGCAMIAAQILQQRESGALVVVASHDRAFLQRVSDSIFCVENGHVRRNDYAT